jgi:hypothetical protein
MNGTRNHLVTGVVLGMLLTGMAFAAPGGKGGKGGGGDSGGGDSGGDPCTSTQSHFPALAYYISSGTRNRTEQTVYLASADGSCARPVLYLRESVVDRSLHLHVNDDGGGFLVVLERRTSADRSVYRVLVLDFVVGAGNVVDAAAPRVLLEQTWFPGTQTGEVITHIGLSPDGTRLLITSDRLDETGATSSRVLGCPITSSPCTPEVLLTSTVEDGSFWFWRVAPSSDPDRFFIANVYVGAVGFPKNHVTIASRDSGGSWTLAADSPLVQSDGTVLHLDADPYDGNRVAWSDSGLRSIRVCVIDQAGQCGAGGWQLADASAPTWSRHGRLAQPELEMPSLLFRGSTSNGKLAYFETFDGLLFEQLPLPSTAMWDAY